MRAGRVTVRIEAASLNAEAARVGRIEVTDLCRKIMNQAIVDCPVDKGFMRGQHFMRVEARASQTVGEVENRAEYAAAVHDGSGPRIIRPRHKRVLKFTVDGRTVFARSVRHPGTRPRPWLQHAAQAVALGSGWNFDR
jgi:hypothetical protein